MLQVCDRMLLGNHSRAAQPASALVTVNIRAHSRRDGASVRHWPTASPMRGGATFANFRDVDRPASSALEGTRPSGVNQAERRETGAFSRYAAESPY